MFAGILVLLGATAAALTAEQINGLAIGVLVGAFVMGLGLLAMSQLLGKRESREYFRLVCPKCGCRDVKAGDFFFNTAVCRECRHEW